MSDELVLQERRGAVTVLTVNRPEKRNALNGEVRCAFLGALAAAAREPDVRVVVLTGAGPKSFVAGADIAELAGRSMDQQRRVMAGPSIYESLWRLTKPAIAAINGYCFGGGLEIALACDMRIASSAARFGQPEISLGLIPGGGATQRLPRLIGSGAAARMIMSGEAIDATEALRLGLVDEVVAPDELLSRVLALADRIAAHSPVALAAAKEAMRTSWSSPMESGLRAEAALFQLCFASADAREGLRAFVEKRAPVFEGK